MPGLMSAGRGLDSRRRRTVVATRCGAEVFSLLHIILYTVSGSENTSSYPVSSSLATMDPQEVLFQSGERVQCLPIAKRITEREAALIIALCMSCTSLQELRR